MAKDPQKKLEQALDAYQVVLARSGDRAAFNLLYRRWYPRLLRFAVRRTGNTEVALDVVQDTSLTIARNLRRLKEPELFGAWAFTILRRRIADHWRSVKSEPFLDDAVDPDTLPGMTGTQPRPGLTRAIDRLPKDLRALLIGHYREGASVAELADRLGVPAGTVKSRLFRARAELRALYHSTELEGDHDATF